MNPSVLVLTLQVLVILGLIAVLIPLSLYVLAVWVTYIEFLGSEDRRLWWRHPPGSGYDHLHSIARFHRISVGRTRCWLRLRRWAAGRDP